MLAALRCDTIEGVLSRSDCGCGCQYLGSGDAISVGMVARDREVILTSFSQLGPLASLSNNMDQCTFIALCAG